MSGRRRRTAELRREEILIATLEVVEREGLAATRVSDVASALGVSPALVFYHFSTKDALVAEAFALAAERDVARLEEIAASEDAPLDRLRRMHLPSPGKAQDIVRHHRLIVKAIDAAEPGEAQKHLRTHLSGTMSELIRIRARHPEYLSN